MIGSTRVVLGMMPEVTRPVIVEGRPSTHAWLSALRQPRAAAVTFTSPSHAESEDAYWWPEQLSRRLLAKQGHLYIVSDGVGGLADGALASRTVVQTLAAAYYDSTAMETASRANALVAAVRSANAALLAMAMARSASEVVTDDFTTSRPTTQGMGATVVAALVAGGTVTVTHAGDSRAYLVNISGARQLTNDHTWVAELMRQKALTPEEAAIHPQRHQLVRVLGRAESLEPEVVTCQLQPGDRLLLASDGLTDVATPEDLARYVARRTPSSAAASLRDLTAHRGHTDDVTVLVIDPFGATLLSSPARCHLALRPTRQSTPAQQTTDNLLP